MSKRSADELDFSETCETSSRKHVDSSANEDLHEAVPHDHEFPVEILEDESDSDDDDDDDNEDASSVSEDYGGQHILINQRSVYNISCGQDRITADDLHRMNSSSRTILPTFPINWLDWKDLRYTIRRLSASRFTGLYATTAMLNRGLGSSSHLCTPHIYSSFWLNGKLCWDNWIDPEDESMGSQEYVKVCVAEQKT